MAPVTATAVGITPQTIDDVELAALLKSLNSFRLPSNDIDGDDILRLVSIVEKYPEWQFEEQVSSYNKAAVKDCCCKRIVLTRGTSGGSI